MMRGLDTRAARRPRAAVPPRRGRDPRSARRATHDHHEVLMDVTLALLADAANVSADGKLNILGIFNALGAHNFPVVHPQMALVLRFEASRAEEGKGRQIELQLVDSDGQKMLKVGAQLVVPSGGPPGAPIRLNHILMLNNVQFPKPGDYMFSILVGDDEKASVELRIVEVRQAPNPQPPPSVH
jgi:hypothetical protein